MITASPALVASRDGADCWHPRQPAVSMAAATLWSAAVQADVFCGHGCAGAISQPAPQGAIEVEFATGARMRTTGPVHASTVRAMIAGLAKGKRRR